jgi:small subunit ribosomal protein S1
MSLGYENAARICLTHKELLGNWEENVSLFRAGETVAGIVRSVEDYGIFVELAPNLAGLAEPKEGVHAGQSVSVYIKAIIPDKMKIKLIIVDVCSESSEPMPLHYFTDNDRISIWQYSTEGSDKDIRTVFE